MNRKKETSQKAPNRVLDLDELESPFFRRILGKMDRLLEEEGGLYLHPSKRVGILDTPIPRWGLPWLGNK